MSKIRVSRTGIPLSGKRAAETGWPRSPPKLPLGLRWRWLRLYDATHDAMWRNFLKSSYQ